MDKQTERFVAAAKRMEQRTRRVGAYVVVDPKDARRNGRVTIGYPADGAGRLHVVAWLPITNGHETQRHYSHASGYGYDKATAAMGGALYWDNVKGTVEALADQGYDWRRQLEAAGYMVLHGC